MSTGTPAGLAFRAAPETIGATALVRLPAHVSRQLPSRGQVAARVTVNGHDAATVLEPDGLRGHWLRLDGPPPAGEVTVTVEVTKDWPEPDVPADLASALDAAPTAVRDVWTDVTPMARWEWVRWVDATANPATRGRRVEVTIDKLADGKRRPCCFDLSSCTDPTVSTSGTLRAARSAATSRRTAHAPRDGSVR